MKKVLGFSFVACLALLASCQPCPKIDCSANASAKNVPADTCGIEAPAADDMSVTVNGVKLTYTDAIPEAIEAVDAKVKELHQLKTRVLENAVETYLLKEEAKKRNVTVEELIKAEVIDKVPAPSEEEIKAFYDENDLASKGIVFEDVKADIGKVMNSDKYETLHTAFLQKLMSKAKISYNIPELPVKRKDLQIADLDKWGDRSKAKVVLVEFSDFQCPYCSMGAKTVDNAVKGYGSKVLRVFKHFPLNFHQNAFKAAQASYCAQQQGKFWEAHDKLFANQNELGEDKLPEYMKAIGLDMDKYNSCMADEASKKAIEDDLEFGNKTGIRGTPTIYINGIEVEGSSEEDIKDIINSELSAK